jgi:hypothetical protein
LRPSIARAGDLEMGDWGGPSDHTRPFNSLERINRLQLGSGMTDQREKAVQEFRRAMKWIAVLSVVVVIAGIVVLWIMDSLSLHAVIATILGLFLSTLLGAGLFSLAFFSDKSGHDHDVTHATKKHGPANR